VQEGRKEPEQNRTETTTVLSRFKLRRSLRRLYNSCGDRRGRYDARDFRGGGGGGRRLHLALNRTDFVGVTVSTVPRHGHPLARR